MSEPTEDRSWLKPGLSPEERALRFSEDMPNFAAEAWSFPEGIAHELETAILLRHVRRDALQEAAKLADSQEPSGREAMHEPYRRGFSDACDEIAAMLRELTHPPAAD